MALRDFLGFWNVCPKSGAPADHGTLCIYPDEVNQRKPIDYERLSIGSDLGDKVIIQCSGFGSRYPSFQNGHYLEKSNNIVVASGSRHIELTVDPTGVLRATVTEEWSAARKKEPCD